MSQYLDTNDIYIFTKLHRKFRTILLGIYVILQLDLLYKKLRKP